MADTQDLRLSEDSMPQRSDEEDVHDKAERYKDQLQRLKADFDNYRKRITKELEAARVAAEDDLLGELFQIADGLDHGVFHANASSAHEGFKEGLELIQKQIRELFDKKNVERIETVDQDFDHNLHECLGRIPGPHSDEDKIVREIRAGYRRGSKILRPAQVLIGKEGQAEGLPEDHENNDGSIIPYR